MKLSDYLEAKPRGEAMRLQREACVSASTIYDHLNGRPIAKYDVAKRLSDATGGEVTIADLCEPAPADVVETAASKTG